MTNADLKLTISDMINALMEIQEGCKEMLASDALSRLANVSDSGLLSYRVVMLLDCLQMGSMRAIEIAQRIVEAEDIIEEQQEEADKDTVGDTLSTTPAPDSSSEGPADK